MLRDLNHKNFPTWSHTPAEQTRLSFSHAGLRGKLLALLLTFGVAPVVFVFVLGYLAARSTITRQASEALDALASMQANHLATELDRERLILQTIAGQLPNAHRLEEAEPATLGRLLVQSLPEGGVFDGLRIVQGTHVVAHVALRNTAPHWPDQTPAADWNAERVVVHRDRDSVLAYLVAVAGPGGSWLEGHVRRADFRRVFSIPDHPVEGAESAVFDHNHRVVFGVHRHAEEDLANQMSRLPADSVRGTRLVGEPQRLLAAADVPDAAWIFVTALPLEVALAPLFRLRNMALGGALGLAVVIVVTGAVAARSVTTPLRRLAAAARHLGREGRHTPLRAQSRDEVGDLVRSFNVMAADLEQSRAEVDRLHNQAMERAQQLATVGELASGVAHEIRNPLTGVRGAVDLALRRIPAHEPSRPLLQEALQQLARIEETTTQLLRYARPTDPRHIRLDPNQLIQRAATIVEPRATAAGIRICTQPASPPLLVRADPELMVQVLVNLMLNGIEATTPPGEVHISVASSDSRASIAVRDTGTGIPPSLHQEIFRPFFTTKHQGSGLGLSISRQIVTRHEGTLTVSDHPGGGTTFIVEIPLDNGGVPDG